MILALGWVPSRSDPRDAIFDPARHAARLPERLLLAHHVRVRDQGREVPCCTSMAVVAALEVVRGLRSPLSPLFLYHVARPDPAVMTDLSLRTALDAATRLGVAPLALHDPPLTAQGAAKRPSDEARKQAVRAPSYARMPDERRARAWRAALAAGFPVTFGFWATEEYESLAHRDVLIGAGSEVGSYGHAAVALGFDDAQETFLVKDSRGVAFGKWGTWRLPYHLVDSPLVAEAWTLLG